MVGRSALGTMLARKPIVQKLTSDPTYERSIRYGMYDGALDTFQDARGLRLRPARHAQLRAASSATRILIPSESLRELALRWGIPSERITVLPNVVEAPKSLDDRAVLRERHGIDGPTVVFAGRLSVQKAVDVALEAMTRVERVDLLLAGDGPDADKLRERSRDLGLDGAPASSARSRAGQCSSSCGRPTPSSSPPSGRTSARARRGARGRNAGRLDGHRRRLGDRPRR